MGQSQIRPHRSHIPVYVQFSMAPQRSPSVPIDRLRRMTPRDPGICKGAIATPHNPTFAEMNKQIAKLIKRIIRRQCRTMYGKGWRKCTSDVKRFRKTMAVIQLDKQSRARSKETNTSVCKSNKNNSGPCKLLPRVGTSTPSSTTTRSRSSKV